MTSLDFFVMRSVDFYHVGDKRRVKASCSLQSCWIFVHNMSRKRNKLLDVMAADIGLEFLQCVPEEEPMPAYRKSVDPISENQRVQLNDVHKVLRKEKFSFVEVSELSILDS